MRAMSMALNWHAITSTVLVACGNSFRMQCETLQLPLQCCQVPVDISIAYRLLKASEVEFLVSKTAERMATNKMYCPTCNRFVDLDREGGTVDHTLRCSCSAMLCTKCKTGAHPALSCAENKAASNATNEALLALVQSKGWKQCPKCFVVIELHSGCYHMTCSICRHEFCFKCLQPWSDRTRTCSSGRCEVWDEGRLLEAAEERVAADERRDGGRAAAAPVRLARLERAMEGLRHNEFCAHIWRRRQGNRGNCERCGYSLHYYGMVCGNDCGSTVCYTCAQFRIPRTGWR
jgi:IBR domain, a half RING-finger domain